MVIKLTEEKEKIVQKLESLLQQLSSVESKFHIGVFELTSKVKKTIDNIKNDVFSIAFFGAFSDGKSTILSVLTNRLDIPISYNGPQKLDKGLRWMLA